MTAIINGGPGSIANATLVKIIVGFGDTRTNPSGNLRRAFLFPYRSPRAHRSFKRPSSLFTNRLMLRRARARNCRGPVSFVFNPIASRQFIFIVRVTSVRLLRHSPSLRQPKPIRIFAFVTNCCPAYAVRRLYGNPSSAIRRRSPTVFLERFRRSRPTINSIYCRRGRFLCFSLLRNRRLAIDGRVQTVRTVPNFRRTFSSPKPLPE